MKTQLVSDESSVAMARHNPLWLFDQLRQTTPYNQLIAQLSASNTQPKQQPLSLLAGLHGSLSSLVAATLFYDVSAPLMVLCSSNSFERYENDLEALLPKESLCNSADQLSSTIDALASKRCSLLLSLFDDLEVPLCSPSEVESHIFHVKVGTSIGYDALKHFLLTNGFEQRDFVEDEGEFSLRGSIVDVYPFGANEPLRIELFGDTVTSLRLFDSNSQLSGKSLPQATLTANFTTPDSTITLLEYLDSNTVVLVDDIEELTQRSNSNDLLERLSHFRCVVINNAEKRALDFESKEQQKLQGNFRNLATLLQTAYTEGWQPLFALNSKREIGELSDFLAQESNQELLPKCGWLPVTLHSGFRFSSLDLYTESDIFGKMHSHKAHRKRKVRGISLKELQKLKVGDYVVHEDYGIGIFKSLETITAGNSEQESVLIEYANGDQLFVNVQNIHLLSKYTASENSTPTLSKLGSTKWAAKKEKVRKKIRDIAINLIKVYAQRKMQPGFAFASDSIYMREFEAAFIFDETPDQLKAINDVKRDMQASHPMDRLICGDAGFGKTEIAMRSAFKAVESKKQVAVLTPTTILAHQHGESFTRRFANFPISIAVLSRFVSRKDQLAILKKIEEGKIDIVIGTHRLVSKDVCFKDLGLLVIDEEQHFGVEVKEKLREQFPTIDTLTMSATPIPRTLQFSMLGARDLSIVSTPPKNRQPVETIITDFDAGLIQSAILREIKREGQVFFLHNRISGLETIADNLRELVPSARIVYAHGQMPTRELEKIMMDFMQQEVDVLISTTIIGSGLDISNANTIIINRADMFGLSDLYQLRGRVGRSERKAYCYLITPPMKTLKKDALQRLAVIESFTELGSGFNIALRDLDIRGAGNLLGAEQSGYIHELGFDLYQKMLEETVAELKMNEFSHMFEEEGNKPLRQQKPCDLVFFFDALIPDYYVAATQERFAFYNRIAKATRNEQLDTIAGELSDRFGKLPEEVTHLLMVTKLKLIGTSLGLEKIDIQPQSTALYLPDQASEHVAQRHYLQYLFTAVQAEWMAEYKPGFKMEKKMKLQLHHPPHSDTTAVGLMDRYQALLQKVYEEAKSEVETITVG